MLEIPSTGSGTLEILVEEGKEVSIGQTVAQLESGDTEKKAATPPPQQKPATEDQKNVSQVLSPAVRRIVAEHKLDPKTIKETGKDNVITSYSIHYTKLYEVVRC